MARGKKPKSRAAKKLPVQNNKPQLYWTRRPIPLYNGKELDRGQIMRLAGVRNDQKLLDQGWLVPLPDDHQTSECGRCGEEFFDMTMREGHGRKRHPIRAPRKVSVNLDELSPQDRKRILQDSERYETEPSALVGDGIVDSDANREETFLNEVAPLNLEKTAASRA